jgi:hypothetical protein
MKKQPFTFKLIALILSGSVLFASCTSTTMIQSTPGGAKLYLNGEPVGTTPYTYSDTKIVGSTTIVKIEMEGYEPLNTTFSRDEEVDVGAIVGGVLVLFPFLWAMKYKPTHTYELVPLSGNQQPIIKSQKTNNQQSKAERLRDLKQLLDEKVLTQEEYEKEKKKILEEDE